MQGLAARHELDDQAALFNPLSPPRHIPGSQPTNHRPRRLATTSVVALPAIGSSTRPPGSEQARMIRLRIDSASGRDVTAGAPNVLQTWDAPHVVRQAAPGLARLSRWSSWAEGTRMASLLNVNRLGFFT